MEIKKFNEELSNPIKIAAIEYTEKIVEETNYSEKSIHLVEAFMAGAKLQRLRNKTFKNNNENKNQN